MPLGSEDELYIVDSCTLLNWVSIITGTDPRHAAFREWVWEAFRRGLFNISETIKSEIWRNSPALSKEIEKRGVKAIDSGDDSAIASEATAMLERFKAEGHLTSDRCVGSNDLQIILTAEHYGLTVITEEAQGKERYNMPTVCRKLGVPCMSSAKLLARYGFDGVAVIASGGLLMP